MLAAAWVLVYHHPVPYIVRVCTAFGVFAPVVLKDKLLLVFLDTLPVSLKRDVEEGIAVEHQL